jgi:hypothetical protein
VVGGGIIEKKDRQTSPTFCVNIINHERESTVTKSPVPEFVDPVFTKTSPKRSFSVIENEHFELVFAKTGSINSGTDRSVLLS